MLAVLKLIEHTVKTACSILYMACNNFLQFSSYIIRNSWGGGGGMLHTLFAVFKAQI